LSVMVTAPVRGPSVVGVKVTSIVQVDPALTVPPEYGQEVPVVVKAKSSLPAILVIESTPVPEFVSVEDRNALVVFTSQLPKPRLEVERLTAGVGGGALVPVPVRPTVCGLPAALSEILSTADRAPVTVGEKVTLTEQEFPTVSGFGDCGQSLLEIVKSPLFAPVIATLVTNRSMLPPLVTVTLCAPLVVLTA
jgi:hypothetical protein